MYTTVQPASYPYSRATPPSMPSVPPIAPMPQSAATDSAAHASISAMLGSYPSGVFAGIPTVISRHSSSVAITPSTAAMPPVVSTLNVSASASYQATRYPVSQDADPLLRHTSSMSRAKEVFRSIDPLAGLLRGASGRALGDRAEVPRSQDIRFGGSSQYTTAQETPIRVAASSHLVGAPSPAPNPSSSSLALSNLFGSLRAIPAPTTNPPSIKDPLARQASRSSLVAEAVADTLKGNAPDVGVLRRQASNMSSVHRTGSTTSLGTGTTAKAVEKAVTEFLAPSGSSKIGSDERNMAVPSVDSKSVNISAWRTSTTLEGGEGSLVSNKQQSQSELVAELSSELFIAKAVRAASLQLTSPMPKEDTNRAAVETTAKVMPNGVAVNHIEYPPVDVSSLRGGSIGLVERLRLTGADTTRSLFSDKDHAAVEAANPTKAGSRDGDSLEQTKAMIATTHDNHQQPVSAPSIATTTAGLQSLDASRENLYVSSVAGSPPHSRYYETMVDTEVSVSPPSMSPSRSPQPMRRAGPTAMPTEESVSPLPAPGAEHYLASPLADDVYKPLVLTSATTPNSRPPLPPPKAAAHQPISSPTYADDDYVDLEAGPYNHATQDDTVSGIWPEERYWEEKTFAIQHSHEQPVTPKRPADHITNTNAEGQHSQQRNSQSPPSSQSSPIRPSGSALHSYLTTSIDAGANDPQGAFATNTRQASPANNGYDDDGGYSVFQQRAARMRDRLHEQAIAIAVRDLNAAEGPERYYITNSEQLAFGELLIVGHAEPLQRIRLMDAYFGFFERPLRELNNNGGGLSPIIWEMVGDLPVPYALAELGSIARRQFRECLLLTAPLQEREAALRKDLEDFYLFDTITAEDSLYNVHCDVIAANAVSHFVCTEEAKGRLELQGALMAQLLRLHISLCEMLEMVTRDIIVYGAGGGGQSKGGGGSFEDSDEDEDGSDREAYNVEGDGPLKAALASARSSSAPFSLLMSIGAAVAQERSIQLGLLKQHMEREAAKITSLTRQGRSAADRSPSPPNASNRYEQMASHSFLLGAAQQKIDEARWGDMKKAVADMSSATMDQLAEMTKRRQSEWAGKYCDGANMDEADGFRMPIIIHCRCPPQLSTAGSLSHSAVAKVLRAFEEATTDNMRYDYGDEGFGFAHTHSHHATIEHPSLLPNSMLHGGSSLTSHRRAHQRSLERQLHQQHAARGATQPTKPLTAAIAFLQSTPSASFYYQIASIAVYSYKQYVKVVVPALMQLWWEDEDMAVREELYEAVGGASNNYMLGATAARKSMSPKQNRQRLVSPARDEIVDIVEVPTKPRSRVESIQSTIDAVPPQNGDRTTTNTIPYFSDAQAIPTVITSTPAEPMREPGKWGKISSQEMATLEGQRSTSARTLEPSPAPTEIAVLPATSRVEQLSTSSPAESLGLPSRGQALGLPSARSYTQQLRHQDVARYSEWGQQPTPPPMQRPSNSASSAPPVIGSKAISLVTSELFDRCDIAVAGRVRLSNIISVARQLPQLIQKHEAEEATIEAQLKPGSSNSASLNIGLVSNGLYVLKQQTAYLRLIAKNLGPTREASQEQDAASSTWSATAAVLRKAFQRSAGAEDGAIDIDAFRAMIDQIAHRRDRT